MEEEGDV